MTEMSQEEMLAQQKANCPFCKIVKGEIPSKKVYEDDIMLAILDINPANKGHVLVLPKEHYFILPVVPPDVFAHVFKKTRQLMKAMRKGLIVPKVTLFIANGGVAGQQSPHFLYHLIPREPNDGLEQLDLQEKTVDQTDIAPSLAQNMQAIMQNHVRSGRSKVQLGTTSPASASGPAAIAPQQPAPQQAVVPPQGQTASATTNQAPVQGIPESKEDRMALIFDFLKQNPEFHNLLMQDPDQVKAFSQQNPGIGMLFEGIDIHEFSEQLKQQAIKTNAATGTVESTPQQVQSAAPTVAPTTPVAKPVQEQNDKVVEAVAEPTVAPETVEVPAKKPIHDVPDAAAMTDEQLKNYLDEKPQLKKLLLENPIHLEELKENNPRIAVFFKNTTVSAVAARAHALNAQPIPSIIPEPELAETVTEPELETTHESEEKEETGEEIDFDALSKYLGGNK